MKGFLAFIGGLVVLWFVLGLLGLIDFRMCIAPKGGCQWIEVDQAVPAALSEA
jgi:hypothetical protein